MKRLFERYDIESILNGKASVLASFWVELDTNQGSMTDVDNLPSKDEIAAILNGIINGNINASATGIIHEEEE